ncbi:MAG: tetratricopeptide repeat protein [Asticcacaulis sp.]
MAQDYAQALTWYQKAADQGYDPARYNIGNMYINGEGVAVDEAKGLDLIEQAAGNGLAKAQSRMATICHDGDYGVARDPVKAYGWALLATDGGDEDAADLIDQMDSANELTDDQKQQASDFADSMDAYGQ